MTSRKEERRLEEAPPSSGSESVALAALHAIFSPRRPADNVAERLRLLAGRISNVVGGACGIRLIDAEGTMLTTVAWALGRQVGPDPKAFFDAPRSARAGHYAEVLASPEGLLSTLPDTRSRKHAADAPLSLLLVALRTDGVTLGTLDLVWASKGRDAEAVDRALVREIAARLALLIENARLRDAELRARGHAELASWALREKTEELEAAEGRFRAALDAEGSGMALLSAKWIILRVNEAFRRLCGYTDAELVGSPITAVIHPADEPLLRTQAAKLQQGAAEETILRISRKHDASCWVTLRASRAPAADARDDLIILHVAGLAQQAVAVGRAPRSGEPDLSNLGRVLANPVNIQLLARLVEAPMHARALAASMHRSEGDIQKKLHALERAGLVASAWRHRDGKTIKEYEATSRTLELSFGPPEV